MIHAKDIDEGRKHYAKWKSQDAKSHILHFTETKHPECINIVETKQMRGYQGLGGGKNRE